MLIWGLICFIIAQFSPNGNPKIREPQSFSVKFRFRAGHGTLPVGEIAPGAHKGGLLCLIGGGRMGHRTAASGRFQPAIGISAPFPGSSCQAGGIREPSAVSIQQKTTPRRSGAGL